MTECHVPLDRFLQVTWADRIIGSNDFTAALSSSPESGKGHVARLEAHLLPQLNRFAVCRDAFSSDLVLGLLMLVAGDRDGTSDLELILC
jgi:hypothetical protein